MGITRDKTTYSSFLGPHLVLGDYHSIAKLLDGSLRSELETRSVQTAEIHLCGDPQIRYAEDLYRTPYSPWKINMDPTNHPLEKEYHLNQTSIFGFKMLIFQGVHLPKFSKRI